MGLLLTYLPDKDLFQVPGQVAALAPKLLGMKYNKKTDVCTVPATLWHYTGLHAVHLHLKDDASAEAWISDAQNVTSLAQRSDIYWGHVHERAEVLRPYQRVGAAFAHVARRCIMADEQGLGKTVQAIVASDRCAVSTRLVVCPSHLKYMWAEHIAAWSQVGHRVEVLTSASPKLRDIQLSMMPRDNITLIVGWEQLRLLVEWKGTKITGGWLAERIWDALVVDEAHRAGDRHAKQTKVFTLASAQAENVICLTGTPVVTNAANMWPVLHALYPARYPSYWQFVEAHVQVSKNHFGGVTLGGALNPLLLRAELSPFVIRRLKADHLSELPPKAETVIWLDMLPQQAKAYRQMAKEMVAEVGDQEIRAPLKLTSYLRCEQLACGTGLLFDKDESNKLDALMQIVADEAPHKMVVVCLYRKQVELVSARLTRAHVEHTQIVGGMSDAERHHAEGAFVQVPECRVLIVSLHAAKEGYTFIARCPGVASNLMVFLGLPDTTKDYDQMCDRLHRLGQTDVVRILVLLSRDTVEEKAVTNLGLRGAMVRQIVRKSGDADAGLS